MKGFLLDAAYDTREDKAVVKLFLIGEDGSFIAADDSFLPYLYLVPSVKPEGIIQEIKDAAGAAVVEVVQQRRKFLGRDIEVLKVFVAHPQQVPEVRNSLGRLPGVKDVTEHDILFVRRYLIDKNLRPMTWVEVDGGRAGKEVKLTKVSQAEGKFPELRILAFDTEVYNPKLVPRGEEDPIIMVSLASNTGIKKVLTWKSIPKGNPAFVEALEDEKAVLQRFADIVNEEDFDVIVGYNSDNFDFPYLVTRLKKLGIKLPLGKDGSEVRVGGREDILEAKINGRVHVDLYPIIRRSVKLSSYVLENVVKDVLGREKEKLPGEKLWEYWNDEGENFKKFLNYSLEDAVAALELSEKFLPLYYELARLVQQPLYDVSRMTAGQLVEWLLMRKAFNEGEMIPNRGAGAEFLRRREDTYAGGYVREPKKGLSENIAVFDFRSLYPSVIVTHNIDPSTLAVGCAENRVPGFEYCFRKDKEGFIPSILKELISAREKVKQEMKKADILKRDMLGFEQQALKLLANSFYGYMGYPRARWYRKECAESVTAFARDYIHKVIRMAEETFRLEVIYGDTDSLFVVIPEDEKKKVGEFLKYVNDEMPGIIELDYEGFYRRGIFVTKKRYALIDEKDKIVVKGLEFVRRDWAPVAKKTQRAVLRTLLKDADPEKAASIVRQSVEDIRKRRVSLEDITIYTQLTKKISGYKNIEPHVEAAKKLEKRGMEVLPGRIIGYIIRRGSESISKRAEPVEYASLDDYDAEYYIDNQIMPAVLRIIEAIGYSKSYLKEGIQQESMEKWFK